MCEGYLRSNDNAGRKGSMQCNSAVILRFRHRVSLYGMFVFEGFSVLNLAISS